MVTTTPTEWLAGFNPATADVGPGGDDQYQPQILQLSNGDILVAWTDNSGVRPASLGGDDIIAQLFNPIGEKIGGTFRLNTITAKNENDFDLAAYDGGFIVSYESGDGGSLELQSDQYTNDLTHVRHDEIDLAGVLAKPQVAARADGEAFMVAYQFDDGVSTDLFIRFVMPVGQVTITIDLNNGSGALTQALPTLDAARLTNGNYAVASQHSDAGDQAIFITIRNSAASAVLSPTFIGGSRMNGIDESNPSIAALTGGGFVVSWTQASNISAQIFDAAGTATTGVLAIAATLDVENEAVVVALDDGGFVAAWDNDTTSELEGRRFTSSGAPVGSVFTITDTGTTTGGPTWISATELADGRIAFGWASTATNQDPFFAIWDPRETTINGTSGNDVLTGRQEASTVNGLVGHDTLYGVDGADTLIGGSGNDVLWGGAQNDFMSGGTGNDVLNGQGGDDFGAGNMGMDQLTGGSGNDELHGGIDNDTVAGGAGNDMLFGEHGLDILAGGDGQDTLFGLSGNDHLVGGNDADSLTGGQANDLLVGGGANDVLIGNTGFDQLQGGAGNDQLFGGGQDDSLVGGVGNDLLDGGGGNDVLSGGPGVDTLVGGAGTDIAFGGADADIFDFNLLAEIVNDKVSGFASGDRIDLSDIEANDGINLTFIGLAGFTGVVGQVNYAKTAASTFINIDTSGNGAANRTIEITNGPLDLSETAPGSLLLKITGTPAAPPAAGLVAVHTTVEAVVGRLTDGLVAPEAGIRGGSFSVHAVIDDPTLAWLL